MRKILLVLLTIITLNSCSTTKKIVVDFTYLDHPKFHTEYYTAGKEELVLSILNTKYFKDIDIELTLGTVTRVQDSSLYSFKNLRGSLDTLWMDSTIKYKKKGKLHLLIKHYEYPITGLGYNGVVLVAEQYLLKGSTFLHEFGHACGLEHYDDVCNLMYHTYTEEGDQVEMTPVQKLIIKKALKDRF